VADVTTRGAGRVAALVAVPVALLAGLLVFWLAGRVGAPATPRPSASPQATSVVPMPAPALGTRAATVCRTLVSHLPAAIRDRARRPVTAAEQNAAWGDPPITLSCGAPRPSVAPTDFLPVLNGVCWHTDQRPGATVWTTLDREVPVSVTVPAGYGSQGTWVQEFTGPIAATMPPVEAAPSGCSG
jgi:hypothetical protein